MPSPHADPAPIDWATSREPVAYETAVAFMEARAEAIAAGTAPEMIWLLEHPPLYTAGTRARPEDLLDAKMLPVYSTGRGGQYTYHGPGQRVAYVMLNLAARGRDVRRFVAELEGWLIDTLAAFNLRGEVREGRVGVWIDRGQGREDKIAAIGIRLRRWVSFHGISLNVEPDLAAYRGIVPCGIAEHGVTSLVDLGLPVTLADADVALKAAFEARFGATQNAPSPDLDLQRSPA